MRPRSDDLDNWWETGTVHTGHASAQGHELDVDEYAAFKDELREQLARKRPPGFAPWPDDNRKPGEEQ